ncbi:MAG: FAD-dependent oxidoreductase, partial [Pseudomonadota bacterium]
MADTLIIGAGMAGLACARALTDAGHRVTVLDKGRGIGGRLATRRTEEGWQFDHGAQYISASGAPFRAAMAGMEKAGSVAPWDQPDHLVGVPGMSDVAKAMASGIELRQRVEVTSVSQSPGRISLDTGTETLEAERVVITVPAPQARALVGDAHPLAAALEPVAYAPCLTLMAVLAAGSPAPFLHARDAEADLAWIAHNSAKPGRPGPGCWVAQASVTWSETHLERDKDDIAARMLPLLTERLGADPAAVRYAAAHRWRYAHVTRPLGAPFLREGGLSLGGDWCLGPRVESAWQSGRAIAD